MNKSENLYKGVNIIHDHDKGLWKIVKDKKELEFTWEELNSFLFHLSTTMEDESRSQEK